MKKPTSGLTAAVFVALVLSVAGGARAEPDLYRLGVFPVQDRTGGAFREAYGQNFRRILVTELAALMTQPLFINAGPGFDYSERQLTLDLAREAKIDVLLKTRLLAVTDRSTWKRLERVLNDSAAGDQREAAVSILLRPTRRDEMKRLVDSNLALLVVEAAMSPAEDLEAEHVFYVSAKVQRNIWKDLLALESAAAVSVKRFKDTGAGRAAAEAAKKIARLAGQWLTLADFPATGLAPSASGTCRLTFGVRYLKQDRTSRNYTVAINGQEVSYAIRNGRVTVDVPGGPFTARVTVQDAPYGMPVQKSYDVNDFISCSGEPKTAFLEIGTIGEASLKWRP